MLTFEREYFERPVYGPDTQCVMDLMAGKITISEVPFAYRGKREFNCAFGNKFSVNLKDPEIQEKFSTIFKNACNAMRQVQDAIKAVQRDALGRDEKMIDSVEEER